MNFEEYDNKITKSARELAGMAYSEGTLETVRSIGNMLEDRMSEGNSTVPISDVIDHLETILKG